MDIQEQMIEFIGNSKYFPVSIEDMSKISGKKSSCLHTLLAEMVEKNQIISIEFNKYYLLDNLNRLTEKILGVISNFHKNFPYLEGIKKSEIRKGINNKKGQNNIHELIFEAAFNKLIESEKIICKDFYYKLKGNDVAADSLYQANVETMLNYFNCRQDLNRICLLSSLAEKLRIDSRHLRNILDDLIKKGEIIKLYDNMYIGKRHLEKMQNKIVEHIQKNGSLTTLEAKDIFGAPRKTTIAILEYFDQHGITQFEDGQRFLIA